MVCHMWSQEEWEHVGDSTCVEGGEISVGVCNRYELNNCRKSTMPFSTLEVVWMSGNGLPSVKMWLLVYVSSGLHLSDLCRFGAMDTNRSNRNWSDANTVPIVKPESNLMMGGQIGQKSIVRRWRNMRHCWLGCSFFCGVYSNLSVSLHWGCRMSRVCLQ
jgi:hypothetical protein